MFNAVRLLRGSSFRQIVNQGIRKYAAEASSNTEGLIVNFSVPHQAIMKGVVATQINASAYSGDMGILPNHVPSIEQLKPGVLEIIKSDSTEKWFLSGGFMIINPDSVLNINAVEAYKLTDINAEAVNSELAESRRLVSSAKNETEKAALEIEIEMYEALQAALKSN
ncbi:hypothetical protein BB559_002440 [Furculomyces boomerangus]|uniref:ATP synthase subunit delta, mitochondrial n=2 Tax=Harpellales TaxID=61421 RepID=A0A2T9YGQ6_9FUNG|nr:hypothetical protein BB559_004100 [Furculomyces boomerangus]PVU96285.1 hypothetical protein BB559_002440 [Furculomyces boomerangus]PVZ97432.1 hypothetical protein BB558_006599 [Smittium angustum]PVZ99304.1 hypothetical protein BB558_004667 [Smittium angustum]